MLLDHFSLPRRGNMVSAFLATDQEGEALVISRLGILSILEYFGFSILSVGYSFTNIIGPSSLLMPLPQLALHSLDGFGTTFGKAQAIWLIGLHLPAQMNSLSWHGASF